MLLRAARWAAWVLLWVGCASVRGRAQEATLVGDAHVSSAAPTVNAGTLSNLDVGAGYTALLQFDLSTLPSGITAAAITKATLRLYCNRADAGGVVNLQTVNGAWTEGGVTYATLPKLGAVVGTTQVAAAGAFVTFDVTAVVQGWVSGASVNDGLALTAAVGTTVQFDSKENDETGHAAELDIVLASGGSGTVGATGATGPAGPVGPQGPAGPQGLQGVAGPVGATGAIGAQGPAGPQGLPGVAGATGAQGPAGPQGIQGLQGLQGASGAFAYQGTYSSVTNYASGDVVQYGGSSWVSEMAGNHGNTPGLVLGTWGLVAAVGATGAAGAQGAAGPAGATGPQGPQGVQGVAGVAGATGATGAAGKPGLVYRGAYSSVTNYALGDVVVWGGASWASLVDFNVGQTPGLVPGYWGVLTEQGAQGPVGATGPAGPTGATGALGPVGPPGETGPQGLQGVAGQAGAQGIPGATGATGLQGPMGPQGVQGPVGLNFTGAYSSVVNYGVGDGVTWQGAAWVSLMTSNHGNTPSLSPSAWAMFAQDGAAGAMGATGATGPAGPMGPAGANGLNGVDGATGARGPQGLPGMVYRGAYASVTNYVLGDVVTWEGSSWVSLVGFNAGQTPDLSPGYWSLLAQQGPVGVQGVQGPVGATGPLGATGAVGPAGPMGLQGVAGPEGPAGAQGLTGATGAVGPMGPQGLQGVAGQAGAQGIPGATGATGLQGPMGPQGVQGPVGMNFVGAYDSTVNYGVGDGVMWQGAGWVSLVASNHGNTPSLSPGQWAMFAAKGGDGAVGATGPVGPQGPAGANGLNGSDGSTGVAGPQGPQGLPGMLYRGAYASATNYVVGDVVSWQGSSWVSLVGFNVGQTPDLSPGSWSMLASQGVAGPQGIQGLVGATGATGATGAVGPAGPMGAQGVAGPQGPVGAQGLTGATGAVGPQGPQGLQGAAGQAGAQGLTGATGATGLQGPAGPQGTQGPVGMNFVGAYDSTANYEVGDGVMWEGAGWVSLTANNHGNTPSLSPAAWAMFAAKGTDGAAGAPGPAGADGAQGQQGIQGLPGAQGLQGLVGPAGPAGATGPQGPIGLTGVQGPVGPAGATGATGATGVGLPGPTGATGADGPQGPAGADGKDGLPGLVWQGAYSSATNYALGDVVSWQGSSWVSLVAGNAGQAPDVSQAYWNLVASQGPAGPQGVQGLIGATGAVGPVGPQGLQGLQGVQGVVGPEGPAGPQGLTGATGATGAVGPQGLQGVAGQSGAQGLTGATGAVGPQGPTGAMGPAGPQGVTGATGAAGAVGMNFRSAWNAVANYAVNDAVTFGGATYLALAANSNTEPDVNAQSWTVIAQPGAVGPTGASGEAATVTIGSVTTLAAGSSATVSNSGTSQAAVLNFGIPQGAAGAAGSSSSGGGSGLGSGSFAAVFHAVSYATVYYAVNSPNASVNENGTTATSGVLAWVPLGCTATSLSVYSQQSNTISVTLRTGVPGAMVPSALVCSVATNRSCTATGSVVVAAGQFVDYEIDGPSGTAAGVWTALQCQ